VEESVEVRHALICAECERAADETAVGWRCYLVAADDGEDEDELVFFAPRASPVDEYRWSPDGSRIAFVTYAPGQRGATWVARADASGKTRLAGDDINSSLGHRTDRRSRSVPTAPMGPSVLFHSRATANRP
jgi:dipeptidyl aminopeptidase/acylaminoacyl peptidase